MLKPYGRKSRVYPETCLKDVESQQDHAFGISLFNDLTFSNGMESGSYCMSNTLIPIISDRIAAIFNTVGVTLVLMK